MRTSNRDDRKLENTVKQSRFKHLRELHKEWTEAGVSASRVITLRNLQEKGYQANHRLITSMPRHIDTVIHAKGGPAKYWVHRNKHQKPDISVKI